MHLFVLHVMNFYINDHFFIIYTFESFRIKKIFFSLFFLLIIHILHIQKKNDYEKNIFSKKKYDVFPYDAHVHMRE